MILDVGVRGRHQRAETRAAADGLVVRTGEQAALVRLESAAGSECWRLVVDGRTVPARLRARDGGVVVTLGPVRVPVTVRRALPVPSRRDAVAGAERHIEILAPMPGLVIETRVAVGDRVLPGAPVVIVEAMKMQMEVSSPLSGLVEEVRVRPGQEVAGGQVLAIVRPQNADGPGETRP